MTKSSLFNRGNVATSDCIKDYPATSIAKLMQQSIYVQVFSDFAPDVPIS